MIVMGWPQEYFLAMCITFIESIEHCQCMRLKMLPAMHSREGKR